MIYAAWLAAAKKMKTITCTKGKLTKKVTAIKPACPRAIRRNRRSTMIYDFKKSLHVPATLLKKHNSTI